jgi:RNA polymerase sigma factor (sigma-70 family)
MVPVSNCYIPDAPTAEPDAPTLTHAERTALVESCLPMARKLAGRYCRPRDDTSFEEAHAEALAILWDATGTYKPGLSSFPGFAWDRLCWRLSRWRHDQIQDRKTLSLSQTRRDSDGHERTLAGDLPDYREPAAHDHVEADELLDGIRWVPGKHDPHLLRALAEGKTTADYAAQADISKWRACQLARRARLRLAAVTGIEVDEHGRRTAS